MQAEGEGVDEVRGGGTVVRSRPDSGGDTQTAHERLANTARMQGEGAPLTQLYCPWQLLTCNQHNATRHSVM